MTPTQTKFLMSVSALVMFILGVGLTFGPNEFIHAAGGCEAPASHRIGAGLRGSLPWFRDPELDGEGEPDRRHLQPSRSHG